jgi:hypothetical protein
VRPLTVGFGILATAPATCGNGLQISGSGIAIEGGIRANGNVMVQASNATVNGAISYGGSKNIASSVVATSIVQDPTPVVAGLAWSLADFLPGGVFSTRSDLVAHIGNWNINGSGAAPGIHVVTGNVNIADSAPDLIGVTIVATGTVNISGGSVLAPASADLPAVLAFGGSCKQTAINLSGASISWSGVLAAPNGVVQVNASQIRGGSILASTIQMSGTDIQIS